MSSKHNGAGHYSIIILLLVTAIVMVYPLYNQLVISLTGSDYIVEASGTTLLPHGFTLSTYKSVLEIPKVARGVLNSIFITAAGLVINIIFTSMGAYVLTKRNLYGRSFFITMIVITMIFEGGLIPDYFLMRRLHLLNSYWSVILYKAVNPYYLIILMRFFDQVPPSLIEAARIDGYNETKILFKIVIPISVAGIATVSLFYGVFHWNEYFRAMIYLTDEGKFPLQVVLRELLISAEKASFIGSMNYLKGTAAAQLDIKAIKAALIIISIIPILVFYPFVLKFFVKGRLQGSVKE